MQQKGTLRGAFLYVKDPIGGMILWWAIVYFEIRWIGYYFAPGEMAEWSIATVLKTVDCYRSGGSNPSLSAQ